MFLPKSIHPKLLDSKSKYYLNSSAVNDHDSYQSFLASGTRIVTYNKHPRNGKITVFSPNVLYSDVRDNTIRTEMMNRESAFSLFKFLKFTPCKSRIISDASEATQVTEYEISVEDFKNLAPVKYLEGPRPK